MYPKNIHNNAQHPFMPQVHVFVKEIRLRWDSLNRTWTKPDGQGSAQYHLCQKGPNLLAEASVHMPRMHFALSKNSLPLKSLWNSRSIILMRNDRYTVPCHQWLRESTFVMQFTRIFYSLYVIIMHNSRILVRYHTGLTLNWFIMEEIDCVFKRKDTLCYCDSRVTSRWEGSLLALSLQLVRMEWQSNLAFCLILILGSVLPVLATVASLL